MTKEKQIEEMAVVLTAGGCKTCVGCTHNNRFQCKPIYDAELLYNAGYRKQSEGEWTRFEVSGVNYGQVYYQHKECLVNETQLFTSPHNFCPNCGAKMRKEDEKR